MARKRDQQGFKVTINFVPFESRAKRDLAYDMWVESQIRGMVLKGEAMSDQPATDKHCLDIDLGKTN